MSMGWYLSGQHPILKLVLRTNIALRQSNLVGEHQHRYAIAPANKLETEWVAVDGIVGRRRGKREEEREPARNHQIERDGTAETSSRDTFHVQLTTSRIGN